MIIYSFTLNKRFVFSKNKEIVGYQNISGFIILQQLDGFLQANMVFLYE